MLLMSVLLSYADYIHSNLVQQEDFHPRVLMLLIIVRVTVASMHQCYVVIFLL